MQQPAFAYVRHGQTPFFRLPTRDAGSDGLEAYRGVQAVLLGVPYDGGCTHHPGSRFAPYHVRRVSATTQGFHPTHRIDVFHALRCVDGGNAALPPFAPAMAREILQQEIALVTSARARPFLVGGDHSITLPVLRALAEAHGPLAVLHVDAHLDTSTGELWGDAFHHGTPFRHAIEEGLIARDALVQVGIRAPWGAPDDDALVKGHGGRVLSPFDLQDPRALARELRGHFGERPVYVSVDVDGFDPSFAPGTGTPVPCGLTPREVTALLRGLAGCRLVGMDVVEVCPALDHADLTSLLAAHLLFEGLALAALGGE